MSASTASADSHAATAPDASAPATAAPMDLKIPITGVVVLLDEEGKGAQQSQ